MISQSDPQQITGYLCNEHVSWFTVHYWYREFPDGDFGSPWIADSQHIYLGSHEPFSPELRADILEKLSQAK